MVSAWYRSPDVAFESLGEDIHLLDLRDLSGLLIPRALEGPAAVIWLALGSEEAPLAEETVVGRVAEQFGLEEEDVRAQTVAFLQDLADHGLARLTGNVSG